MEEIQLNKQLNNFYNYCFIQIRNCKNFEKLEDKKVIEFIYFKLQSCILSNIYDKIYNLY